MSFRRAFTCSYFFIWILDPGINIKKKLGKNHLKRLGLFSLRDEKLWRFRQKEEAAQKKQIQKMFYSRSRIKKDIRSAKILYVVVIFVFLVDVFSLFDLES
jgi:hypothetical protein